MGGIHLEKIIMNVTDEIERWKDIDRKNFEGLYQISSFGRVKSLGRLDAQGHKRKEKLLSLRKTIKKGMRGYYLSVILHSKPHKSNCKVHRLVAEEFLPNPLNYKQVNHIDGDKSNNHYKNLEWCSQSQNSQHAHDTGLVIPAKGVSHGRNKLTEEQVKELYLSKLKGVNREDFVAQELGRVYGVNGRMILSIYRKEAWKWLTDSLD